MNELTEQEVKDIAGLARIELRDAEIATHQKDLTSVLGYFEKLQGCDTDHVDEVGHITGMENVYRSDVIAAISDAEREMHMKNIPTKDGEHIAVKNVL